MPMTTIIYVIHHLASGMKGSALRKIMDMGIGRKTVTGILRELQLLMQHFNEAMRPVFTETDYVEIDEMYIDWKNPANHVGEKQESEGSWLIGLITRDGQKMWIEPLKDRKKETIKDALKGLFPDSGQCILFTDALASYNQLDKDHAHFQINKKWGFARNSYRCCNTKAPRTRQFTSNIIRVHVNTIENNWMHLRRLLALRSAYSHPEYLMYTVHEFIFNWYGYNWFDLLQIR
jgi:hypothetical protein